MANAKLVGTILTEIWLSPLLAQTHLMDVLDPPGIVQDTFCQGSLS
jgi:hypothetical protein